MVIGASGNVGTALLRRLHTDGGWEVTGVARRSPDQSEPPYDAATWLSCDIGAPDAPRILATALVGVDAIVDLAWSINPATDEPPMDHTNLAGSQHVLQAVADAGVPHLICASSCAAYGAAPRWSSVTEDWARDGITGSAYSLGKARLERLLDTYDAEHPDITVARIRPCAIVQRAAAGEFARWLLGPFVPASLLGRPWLMLPFWPGLRAQLVHSEDVAEAIRLILLHRASGPFNLAAGDVLDTSALASGVGGRAVPVPKLAVLSLAWGAWRAGLLPIHPGWLRLADRAALVDTGRARSELGWLPTRSAASALAELVAGLREDAGTRSPPLVPSDLHGLGDRVRSVRWGVPSHQTQSPGRLRMRRAARST
ncbi:MAG TPA: NAD-dependent epimerase/dehydratase family protein [Pseudonocardiaceae bacterium]|jgi:nucleoside-diphosphate-sugar epimerase